MQIRLAVGEQGSKAGPISRLPTERLPQTSYIGPAALLRKTVGAKSKVLENKEPETGRS